MKVVIVGGVAGGATAAARIRRLDEHAEIVVFERTGYISYANCGLPYYIGGIIKDPEELTLQTPESFWTRFRVDMRVRHEVVAIHPERKTVSVRNLMTGNTFEEGYDKLLLSPGAKARKPSIPGIDCDRIFTLRTVEDTFRIRDYVDHNKPMSALVVGGGFIGIEMAENLREQGLSVTLVEQASQVLPILDREMAAFVHGKLRDKGVSLLLGCAVKQFSETNAGVRVEVEGSESITTDMVLLAVGVAPDTALAKDAGLELGIHGSIVVDEHMRTSVADIYAVGDAVQIKNTVSGEKALISLAGPANKQGRVAADNICGRDSCYRGASGSSVLKVFDMTVAVTGLTERASKAAGIDCDKVILAPASHAGYYPGGRIMTMKVVFEQNTYRLLGAQIVGFEGVDKRIDVLATAMQAGLTATDLAELELAYAPPFSSAKDPVNMAGFMIENIKNGTVKQWYLEDIENLPRDGSVTLLDTRTAGEYSGGHVDGFVNIPVDELRERLCELPSEKPVYVICQSGLRSYIACRILEQNGLTCYNFAGGYRLVATVLQDQTAAERAAACGAES